MAIQQAQPSSFVQSLTLAIEVFSLLTCSYWPVFVRVLWCLISSNVTLDSSQSILISLLEVSSLVCVWIKLMSWSGAEWFCQNPNGLWWASYWWVSAGWKHCQWQLSSLWVGRLGGFAVSCLLWTGQLSTLLSWCHCCDYNGRTCLEVSGVLQVGRCLAPYHLQYPVLSASSQYKTIRLKT